MSNYKKQIQEAQILIETQIEMDVLKLRKKIQEELSILDFILWKQNIKLEIANLKIWHKWRTKKK